MKTCSTCHGPIRDEVKGCYLCPKNGPGTELEKLIPKIFGKSEGCECQNMKVKMNQLGPKLCKVHLDALSSELAGKNKVILNLVPHRFKLWKAQELISKAIDISSSKTEELFAVDRCSECWAIPQVCQCKKGKAKPGSKRKQQAKDDHKDPRLEFMKPRLTIDQLQDSFIREVQLRRVVDGDTLDVYIENGFTQGLKENVRLSWVDTPEPKGPERPAGEWVTKKVQYWLKDEDILWLHSLRYDRDRYGRVLADIYKKNGENLNEWLIINSYAWPTDEDGSIIGSRDITRLNLPEGIINQVLTNQAT